MQIHFEEAEDEDNGPTSLPYFINSSQTPNGKSGKNASKKPCVPAQHSNAQNGDHRKAVTRSQSVRTKQRPNDLAKEQSIVKATSSSRDQTKSPPPQFVVGGRVSLCEQNNMSRAAKITNVVKDKIRMRPRSHSPQKQYEPKSSSVPPEDKAKRQRDSFGGFFERFNRMIGTSHLPPPHNNNNNSSSNNANTNQGNGMGHQQRPKGANVIANALSPTKAEAKEAIGAATSTNKVSQSSMLLNKRTDFNQTKKAHQMPETISVRDRKATKQVRHYYEFIAFYSFFL